MADEETALAAKHHRWEDIPPEAMNPLLTRQYVSGEKSMVARILLKKGCIVPTHQHPNEQIAYILSGALEFMVAGQVYIVRAGEILVIPGGVPHSAIALEDTIDLDLFSPPRQDWLANKDQYLRHTSDK